MVDVSKLSPMPWKSRPLPHDDWGTLRDANNCPVASFISAYHLHPWKEANKDLEYGSEAWEKGPPTVAANMEFTALASAAFDVMARRGWTVAAEWSDHGKFIVNGWHVVPARGQWDHHVTYPDPFTALVEADKWYTANVES